MNGKIVNHAIFDQAFGYVTSKVADFWIQSYGRNTKISASTIKNFAKDGYTVLAKADDGKGFLLLNGKKREYIFAGQLLVVAR